MNVRVTVAVPLTIIVFVSDVYSPPTEEYPTRYPLRSCKSNCVNLRLDVPDATFEIVKSERNPRKYCLIEKLPDSTTTQKCCFRKTELDFVSLMDAEITMMIYPTYDPDNPLKITCVFQRNSLARKFYRDMRRGVPYQKVLLLQASYLLKSDDSEMGTEIYLYADCFENYVTMVMEDFDDDPFLIFPTGAVSQIVRSDSTEISVYMNTITGEEVHFKFGFIHEMVASAFSELLHKLCRHIRVTTAEIETYRRLHDDPRYQRLFDRIEELISRRIARSGLQ